MTQRSNSLSAEARELNSSSALNLLGNESILEASCFYFPLSFLSGQSASMEAKQARCGGRTQLEARPWEMEITASSTRHLRGTAGTVSGNIRDKGGSLLENSSTQPRSTGFGGTGQPVLDSARR